MRQNGDPTAAAIGPIAPDRRRRCAGWPRPTRSSARLPRRRAPSTRGRVARPGSPSGTARPQSSSARRQIRSWRARAAAKGVTPYFSESRSRRACIPSCTNDAATCESENCSFAMKVSSSRQSLLSPKKAARQAIALDDDAGDVAPDVRQPPGLVLRDARDHRLGAPEDALRVDVVARVDHVDGDPVDDRASRGAAPVDARAVSAEHTIEPVTQHDRPPSLDRDAPISACVAELEHRRRLVHLARPQDHRGEVRLVRRVGKVMRLERQSVAVLVDVAALSYGACRRGSCR